MTKKSSNRAGIKPQSLLWFSKQEIKAVLTELEQVANVQYSLIFKLLLATGQKYSRLAKTPWGNFNSRLGILYLKNGRSVFLPDNTAQELSEYRETAKSELEPIIKLQYKKFWEKLEGICVRLDIKKSGVLTVRNTFAFEHWKTHKSKHKLQSDLGLSSLRYLPKEIFQTKQGTALFQGVL